MPRFTQKKLSDLPVDSPERRRLPVLMRRAWYGLNQAFRRRIAHTGVTPDQFTVMRTLMESDVKGLAQSQLAVSMSSDPNTIASLLERMSQNGWLERKTHEKDKRAYRILMKEEGKLKYEEVRRLAIDLQTEVLSGLPEEKREQFLMDLATVADGCRLASRPVAK